MTMATQVSGFPPAPDIGVNSAYGPYFVYVDKSAAEAAMELYPDGWLFMVMGKDASVNPVKLQMHILNIGERPTSTKLNASQVASLSCHISI